MFADYLVVTIATGTARKLKLKLYKLVFFPKLKFTNFCHILFLTYTSPSSKKM